MSNQFITRTKYIPSSIKTGGQTPEREHYLVQPNTREEKRGYWDNESVSPGKLGKHKAVDKTDKRDE